MKNANSVFGSYSVTGVLLKMGAEGFTVSDAKAFLTYENLRMPKCLNQQLTAGRRMKDGKLRAGHHCGVMAKMSGADFARIKKFKGAKTVAIAGYATTFASGEVDVRFAL